MRTCWFIAVSLVLVGNVLGCSSSVHQDETSQSGDEALGAGGIIKEDLGGRIKAVYAKRLLKNLGDVENWILPTSIEASDYEEVPQDPKNPLSVDKVELGRQLFNEPALASATRRTEGLRTFSCATCHNPEASFGTGSTFARGIGEGGTGDLSSRKVRSEYLDDLLAVDIAAFSDIRLVNLAYTAKDGGWQGEFDPEGAAEGFDVSPDGLLAAGFDGLESFVHAALGTHGFFKDAEGETPNSESVLSPESGLTGHSAYKKLFDAAFPEFAPEVRMGRSTAALAIAAYLRTVLTTEAPFQKFLRSYAEGDMDTSLMSLSAFRGADLFFGKADCSSCHSGKGLSGSSGYSDYYTLGTRLYDATATLPGVPATTDSTMEMRLGTYLNLKASGSPLLDNLGRYTVTGQDFDKGEFKVVSPYGAGNANVHTWGHGGAHSSLRDFVQHIVGGYRGPTIDPTLVDYLSSPVNDSPTQWLTSQEIDDITQFMTEGLEDPGLGERYGMPEGHSLAGLCTPNDQGDGACSL